MTSCVFAKKVCGWHLKIKRQRQHWFSSVQLSQNALSKFKLNGFGKLPSHINPHSSTMKLKPCTSVNVS